MGKIRFEFKGKIRERYSNKNGSRELLRVFTCALSVFFLGRLEATPVSFREEETVVLNLAGITSNRPKNHSRHK